MYDARESILKIQFTKMLDKHFWMSFERENCVDAMAVVISLLRIFIWINECRDFVYVITFRA